jgi:hypothetical protein
MYTVYRIEKDQSKTVVACVDDLLEVGPIVDEERKKIDWEATFVAEWDGEHEPESDDP